MKMIVLFSKLRQNNISGKLLNLLFDFLRKKKTESSFKRTNLTWTTVNAGVPQGSILGPLFCLIYQNALAD